MQNRPELMRVTLGEIPPGLLVKGGTVVNVYTGECLHGWEVAVAGDRIAAVGPPGSSVAGPATRVLDVTGKVVVPGFIDGHTHMDAPLLPSVLVPWALRGGTTTIITETEEITSAMGLEGARWFLEAIRDQPARIYVTAPTITYLCADDGTARPLVSLGDMETLLDHPLVLGLGEVYWHVLVAEPERLLPLIEAARRRGKRVEGHTAGARASKLQACAAAGVSSCHEPINTKQALERLRLGLHVMLREGSVRRDLEAMVPLREEGIDLRRVVLVSDALWPDGLVSRGYMDAIVQRAIDLGFDPVEAIQMATLNAAEHFGLDHEIGGIAPGRRADLVVLPSLTRVKPETVIAGGQVVVQEGECRVTPRVVPPPAGVGSPSFPRPLTLADFVLSARGRRRSARIRAVEVGGDILTAELAVELPVRDGQLQVDPERDLLKLVAFDRRGRGRLFVGVVAGFGLRDGAAVSSVTFDTADVVVIGAREEDMLQAVQAVLEAGGGYGVVKDGHLEFAPLPVGGIISTLSAPELAARMEAVESGFRALGCQLRNPWLTLQTLSFTAIPTLRISSRGLLDVKTNCFVDLFL